MMNQYLVSHNYRAQPDHRTDLELFKNLLQPHFLFNSLNNLYALSLRRSDQTPDAIAGLSHLLERVVNYSRKDLISLSEEIALIQDYISLERIWLGDFTFLMDFQVKGDTSGVMIPPLAIYTLVENAFKHGIRKCESNGWITFHLVVKKDKVLLKVRNATSKDSRPGLNSPVSNTGLGIQAIRKLMDGSYRRKYYLDARCIGNVYAVDLIIDRPAA